MKKCFVFIILIGLFFDVCSQENVLKPKESYIYANLRDTNSVKRNEKGLVSLNKSVTDIFNQFNVTSFRYAFPKVNNAYLKQTAVIECECDAEKLIMSLESKVPDFFYDIYQSKAEDEPMYVPSDDMWNNYYSDDSRSWLWHLPKIQADKAWDITKGSSDINIAIFDCGFDITNPELVNKINPPYNPHTGNPFTPNTNDHGTRCAGSAAAETDGGGGLAAIGFNTNLIAYDYPSSLEALVYNAVFEMDADVITFSWFGSTSASTTMKLLVKEALDRGTVIVRAAGNKQSDSDNQAFPFAHQVDERIIIVGATDKNDNHTTPYPNGETYANYPEIDICAPGYEIMVTISTLNADGTTNTWPYYGFQGGTSISAPIVAGVCALLKSIDKNLTPAEIQHIIKVTADPIADAHLYPGQVGAGRINAYKAVRMACKTTNFINRTVSTNQTSTGCDIYVKNVVVNNNAKLILDAIHETTIDGPFEIQLGSELEIR